MEDEDHKIGNMDEDRLNSENKMIIDDNVEQVSTKEEIDTAIYPVDYNGEKIGLENMDDKKTVNFKTPDDNKNENIQNENESKEDVVNQLEETDIVNDESLKENVEDAHEEVKNSENNEEKSEGDKEKEELTDEPEDQQSAVDPVLSADKDDELADETEDQQSAVDSKLDDGPFNSLAGAPSREVTQLQVESGIRVYESQIAEKIHEESIPQAPPLPQDIIDASKERPARQKEKAYSALQPEWSFGLNRHVPLLNLTNNSREMILYNCAHLAILYDYRKNTQHILQGHSNAITCSTSSSDARWIATGDRGVNSMVIIWDTITGMPVRTMFEPHPTGVVAISLTPDAKYLATVSAEKNQTLAIWDWTTGDELPLCTASLSADYGMQHYVKFNPDDVGYVVTNSETQVLFFCWKGGNIQYFAPPLTDKDFNKPVGRYSNSIFLKNSSRALTATSQGLCVLWDSNKPLTKVTIESTPDKRAVKLVPMHERPITVLTTTDEFLVTGDTAGHVKFFGQDLQIIYWYQNINFGPINAISFRYHPELNKNEDASPSSAYPTDATIASHRFIVRDFVVGTSTAVYASVTVDGTVIKVIHRDHDAAVHALAAHPFLPRIATGGYSGLLKVWNYIDKVAENSRYFDRGNAIRCCTFDASGQFLAVGFNNGILRVLDAVTLKDATAEPFHLSHDAITHVAFSEDSKFLATADLDFTTTLYRAGNLLAGEATWLAVARHRSHYKTINDLLFGNHPDTHQNRLLTLSKDRRLVEYDLVKATKDNLPLLAVDVIEQSATPLAMTWYPPIVKEQFLCTANNAYKLKLYNTTTKMCRKTLLGPTFGSTIKKMSVLPHPNAVLTDRRYLVFIIDDKLGLLILPLDGNPHNSMCFIAHPDGITNMACSFDGRFVFTAGGTDASVHMWGVHTEVLDAQSLLGGEDLVPFYGLLDGGRDGELFAELEDYFYYAQLRSQGINSMDRRRCSEKIPVSEVPFLMRALGFYPSEQEIQDMLNEVKFSKYVNSGQYVTEVDLGDLIKLYINHRPAFGLSLDRIQWAFEKLGVSNDSNCVIERSEMFDLLQNRGEHMTEYELAEYLTTLLGYNPEGGSCEMEEFNTTTAGDIIENNIPFELTADMFTTDLLGFGMALNVSRSLRQETSMLMSRDITKTDQGTMA